MDNRQKPKVLIISTQTPRSWALAGIQAGRTGQMLQGLTDGGLVHMHRDKGIKDSNEHKIFTDHLASNGWVFITGHGGTGNVKGEYRTDTSSDESLDIECSAKDYANLLMTSKALTKGDHINIMLFVCYGGDESKNKNSFARELASALSEAGISSHIIASSNVVDRISDFKPKHNEIRGEQLKFRTNKDDILIYDTDTNGNIKNTSPNEDVYITKHGPILSSALQKIALSDNLLLSSLQNIFGKYNGISKDNLNLTAKEAEALIAKDKAGIIFRKSSEADKIAITYYNNQKRLIEHAKTPYKNVININGTSEIQIDPTFIESVKGMMKRRALAHHQSQMWQTTTDATSTTTPGIDKKPSAGS